MGKFGPEIDSQNLLKIGLPEPTGEKSNSFHLRVLRRHHVSRCRLQKGNKYGNWRIGVGFEVFV